MIYLFHSRDSFVILSCCLQEKTANNLKVVIEEGARLNARLFATDRPKKQIFLEETLSS